MKSRSVATRDPAVHDLIGKVIASRYRIESVLGAGGIGTVYRAIQDPLDRPVALKMLHPEFSQKPDLRRRFVREARAVAALAHPNIAMVHDFGIDQNSALYMAIGIASVVRYYRGGNVWKGRSYGQEMAG